MFDFNLEKYHISCKNYDIFSVPFEKQPITGFIIEKRDRGGEWVKVNTFPTQNTSMTVQGLHEGMKYDFRVTACSVSQRVAPLIIFLNGWYLNHPIFYYSHPIFYWFHRIFS
jgi:hypothetical protein